MISTVLSKDSIWKKFEGKWQKEKGNPILDKGKRSDWNKTGAHGSSILKINDLFYWYYSGWCTKPTAPGKSLEMKNVRIGLAISKDGITWTKAKKNPVLGLGEKSSWDCEYVDDPCVIKNGSIFEMWYQGGFGKSGKENNIKIDHAISEDGIHWRRYPDKPVLEADQKWKECSNITFSA